VRHALGLAVALVALWLLLSGHYEPLILAFGAASVGLVLWIAARMAILDGEAAPVHLVPQALTYWPWLLKEIVVANVQVARIVLSPRPPIGPTLIRAPMAQRSELGRVVYANSITLTPGTVSVDMDGNDVIVHALTRAGADGVLEGTMNRKAAAMEGGDGR